MKKTVAFLLSLVLLIPAFAACGSEISLPTEETATFTETKTEEINHDDDITPDAPTDPEPETKPGDGPHMLDGKKIIFIGNSYTYYGNAVLTNARSQLTQAERVNNRGYFYQICRLNGAKNVNVTNWTFGGHSLDDLFTTCAADRGCNGVDHKSYLTDRNYDYVFIQEHGNEYDETREEFLGRIDTVLEFFREGNPDTKFFFFAQRRIFEKNAPWLSAIKELPAKGITVVEWGALVHDIIAKKISVPGATMSYNQNSFIVRQSASDGYHPNLLTGYITAQMAYCAITGESAVGQRYDFCMNSALSASFDAKKHVAKYYKDGATTNMEEIFRSPEDMKGLQTLMDQYLASHYYKEY